MVEFWSRSIRANALDRTQHSASNAWRVIEWSEWCGGILSIDRVQRVLGKILVEGIVGVARFELVARIRRVAGIDLNDGIQRILRIVGVDQTQRIIGTVLVDRMEDVVVALVLFREARFGE